MKKGQNSILCCKTNLCEIWIWRIVCGARVRSSQSVPSFPSQLNTLQELRSVKLKLDIQAKLQITPPSKSSSTPIPSVTTLVWCIANLSCPTHLLIRKCIIWKPRCFVFLPVMFRHTISAKVRKSLTSTLATCSSAKTLSYRVIFPRSPKLTYRFHCSSRVWIISHD